jgi:hypothetical protein
LQDREGHMKDSGWMRQAAVSQRRRFERQLDLIDQ